jgi:GT2 family glycosyltransferase
LYSVGVQSTPPVARPFIRVVVINFDGGDITLRCLDALRATHYPSDRLQIVVVDNASVDGLNWVLKERYPDVVLIESDVNEGFARGCNIGLRDLDGIDFVALINNDAIVDPDWLEPLLAGFTGPKVGAVVPKLLLNVTAHTVVLQPTRLDTSPSGNTVGVRIDEVVVDGVVRTADVRFDERHWTDPESLAADRAGVWSKGRSSVWWPIEPGAPEEGVTLRLSTVAPQPVDVSAPAPVLTAELDAEPRDVQLRTNGEVRIVNSAGGALYAGWSGGDRGFLEPDLGQYDDACEVFAWCGGAVLLRVDYLREVGVFDPSYFLYYEDFDLSWRGRSAGWTYRYEPTSRVFHEHAYSSKAGSAFFAFWVDRNRRLTLVKNAPARVAVRAVAGSVVRLTTDLGRHTVAQLRRRRPPSPGVVKRRLLDFGSFARALPGAWRERRRLARTRVVSQRDIAAWMVHK